MANGRRSSQSTIVGTASAFFSVNVVARKPGKNTPATNPYLKKFLLQIPWKPRNLAVFAGQINYPVYGPLDRLVIRLIMWMTNGPTDPKSVVEFTNWEQVRAFGRRLILIKIEITARASMY